MSIISLKIKIGDEYFTEEEVKNLAKKEFEKPIKEVPIKICVGYEGYIALEVARIIEIKTLLFGPVSKEERLNIENQIRTSF